MRHFKKTTLVAVILAGLVLTSCSKSNDSKNNKSNSTKE